MEKKGNYEKYISENEEVRSGFKVSSNRKKIRNIQLGLLEELKKICEKHDIKYYTSGGTTLGAIRHKGYIPWDDDMDLVMFRDDYEKFRKIAPKELPNYIKLCIYHQGYSKLININTTALGDENWWDEDFVGGIWIDIFPIDYASRFLIINKIKSVILLFFRLILLGKKCDLFITRMEKWKQICVRVLNFVFGKIGWTKLFNLHEKISKKVYFKGNKIYTGWCPYLYYPENIFYKSHNVNFENTIICIPDGYDNYLKIVYGNYMKPVIDLGGHYCRYSVNMSYKDIIITFDINKTNEDNYNSCKSLFVL